MPKAPLWSGKSGVWFQEEPFTHSLTHCVVCECKIGGGNKSLPRKLAQVGWLSRQEFMGVLMRNEIHNSASRAREPMWVEVVSKKRASVFVRVSFIFQKPTAGNVTRGRRRIGNLSLLTGQTSCWLHARCAQGGSRVLWESRRSLWFFKSPDDGIKDLEI